MKTKNVIFWVVGFLFLSLSWAYTFSPPGTKAKSMGGAFTAVADDISAVFYNPAGLVNLRWVGFDLSLSSRAENAKNLKGLYNLYRALEDEDFDAAKDIAQKLSGENASFEPTLNFNLHLLGKIGFSALMETEFLLQEIQYSEPPPQVEIKDLETVLGTAYITLAGNLPLLPFSLGGNIKIIANGKRHWSHHLITENETITLSKEESDAEETFSFDLGILYPKEKGRLKWGLMVENITEPEVKFPDMTTPQYRSLKLKRKVNVGVSYKPPFKFPLTLACDVQDLGKTNTLHLGAELRLPLLSLRAGLAGGNLTLGLGAKLLFLSFEGTYSKEKGDTPFISFMLLNFKI